VPGKPIVRGYDTGALFREDCLERIKHLQAEIDASMKKMAQLEKQYAVTEERFKRLKRVMDITD